MELNLGCRLGRMSIGFSEWHAVTALVFLTPGAAEYRAKGPEEQCVEIIHGRGQGI